MIVDAIKDTDGIMKKKPCSMGFYIQSEIAQLEV